MPQRDPQTGRFIKAKLEEARSPVALDIPVFAVLPWRRCKVVDYLTSHRCELKGVHPGPHAIKRGWGIETW